MVAPLHPHFAVNGGDMIRHIAANGGDIIRHIVANGGDIIRHIAANGGDIIRQANFGGVASAQREVWKAGKKTTSTWLGKTE